MKKGKRQEGRGLYLLREESLSASSRIASLNVSIFDLSVLLRSSKYETYPLISLSISSTLAGLLPPKRLNGNSTSSLPLLVISYAVFCLYLINTSAESSSSSGYTEPGDGLHQPGVMPAMLSSISAPVFGERSIMKRIQVRSHRLLPPLKA